LPDRSAIFNIRSEDDFIAQALKVFRFQYEHNSVYRQWCEALKVHPEQVNSLANIPFLPIEFFKSQKVISSPENEKTRIFLSSGTTKQSPSKHYVNDISLYEESFLKGFNQFYGDPADYIFLCLLPGYLERSDSSLVYMFNKLMEISNKKENGSFLNAEKELLEHIEKIKKENKKCILIGVSYALLDLCGKVDLSDNFMVMETGGMKGKREEMTKEALHAALKKGLGIKTVHSEYGMTELLSQAYSKGEGMYISPPWLKFLIRDINDPLQILKNEKTGGINIIDLANINSCSFIATKDLGKISETGLEIMGRYDESDIRGCNLLMM
jgi:phenylacetate-coenzyme A ligase PaaK-like adenylate-forming protein